MQFAPKEYHFGEDLGRQLGSGLTNALGSLARFKLQDVMQRHQEKQRSESYEKFRKGLGWLAVQPESVQKTYIENLLNEHPELLDEQQQGIDATGNMMEQMQQMKPETQMLNQLGQLYQRQGPMNAGQEMQGALQGMLGTGMPQMGEGARLLQQAQQRGTLQPQGQPGRIPEGERSPTGKRYNARQRFELERDERKAALKEQQQLEKTYRPVIMHMSEQNSALIDQTRSLDMMEQLIKKDKLPSPKLASALEFLNQGATVVTPWGSVHLAGLNFKSALGKNAEEFEKLSNDFIKNAKNVFGNRITDNDLKAFMSTVPNLMMTNEGKLRVIRNIRLYNEGIKARHDAMKEVLRENNGRPPRNMELMIEERASKRLDEIAKEFAKGPEKKPKGVVQKVAKTIGKAWDLLPGPGL